MKETPDPHLRQAEDAARQGRFLEALRVLAHSQDRRLEGTLDFNIVFDSEKIFVLDGRDRPSCDAAGARSALAVLREARKIPGARALSLLLEGAVRVCEKKYPEAVRVLKSAQAAGPARSWNAMWMFQARCQANFMAGRTHRMQDAIAELDRAIRLQPDNAHAYAWRSRVLKHMTLLRPALEDITQALRLSPDYLWALAVRGNLHSELGLFPQALADCAELVGRCPDKAWAWAQSSRVKARCGPSQSMLECLAELNKAVELEPSSSIYLAWRGEVLRILGRPREAEADFRRSLKMAPRYPLTLMWLAKLRILEGDVEEAAALLDEAMPELGGNVLAASYRWQARLCAGRFEKAVEDYYNGPSLMRPEQLWTPQPKSRGELISVLDSLTARRKTSPWAYAWRGKILASMGEPDLKAALSDLERALKLNSRHAWARLWRAEVVYALDGAAAALPEFKKARRLNSSGQAEAWLGKASLELGDPARALRYLDQAIERLPDDDRLRSARAQALIRLGRPQPALDELTPLRLSILQSFEGYYWRAEALAQEGQTAQALDCLDKALVLRENFPPAHVLKGRLLRRSGRLEDALAELRRARTRR